MQNVLQYNGKFYVCGTGRQTLVRSKTSNDNYYLLTMAAIAQEIRYRRGREENRCGSGSRPPTGKFWQGEKGFREYLFRKEQPLRFRYEDESYEIQIQDVKLFPQGYSALALHPECVRDEPSVLLADIGGWTVDLMRLDNSVPNAATCRSLELGVIRCVDEITEQVRRNTGLSVTDIQIERVLNGQSCSMDPAAKRNYCPAWKALHGENTVCNYGSRVRSEGNSVCNYRRRSQYSETARDTAGRAVSAGLPDRRTRQRFRL